MPKKPLPPAWEILRIYGIWSFADSKVVFVSLSQEEVEWKMEIEGYDENYGIIRFDAAIDLNSLGQ